MKITIRDVARECKVSPFTVSSVINQKRAVKKETKEKVLAAISRLGYDPAANVPYARSVKIDTLGLVVPMEEAHIAPFYFRAISAFKTECSNYGFETVLYSQNDIKEKLESAGPAINAFPCAGLVFYCPFDSWDVKLSALTERNISLVLIRRPSRVPGVVTITNDDEAGLRLALDYLRKEGHSNIALMGIDDTHTFLRRHTATYREYHRENGWPFRPELVTGVFEPKTTENGIRDEKLERWWGKVADKPYRPTAVICRDDRLAFLAISRLERLGVRVPEDLSVVGFDDDYGNEGMPVPLTTIRIPVEEMIAMAVRTLDDARKGRKTGGMNIEMPLTLVVRESTRKIQ